MHHVSKTANLFFSELCQISTNFDNYFSQKDGKEAKIMQGALTFRITYNARYHTVSNASVSVMVGLPDNILPFCQKTVEI